MSSKKIKVKKMFDSIAYRYDLLNHLLSFGMDKYWRRKSIKLAEMDQDTMLLDIACGTGDFAIEAKKQGIKNIIGGDFSRNMLHLFNEKSEWIRGKTVQLAAEHIPLKDNSLTGITVAFGVRNFYDMREAFSSFYRVLKVKGKAIILEFRMPENPVIKSIYKFYFKRILPVAGGIISGNKEAYKYLPNSVEDFDQNADLVKLLTEAGFSSVQKYSMTFGIVQLIICVK